MKRMIFNLKRSIAIITLLLTTLVAASQGFVDSDYPFVYYYNASSLGIMWPPFKYYPDPEDIEKIPFSELPDEMTIKKRLDVDQDTIENLIRSFIPDAEITWDIGIDTNICYVISDSNGLDETIKLLIENDGILSARHMYTRKMYMDLKKIYPVPALSTYAITDEIKLFYLNHDIINEANNYLVSKGFEVIPNEYGYDRATVKVSKTADIISVANMIYESGYFLIACPSWIRYCRPYSDKLIDKANLPFYGNTYLYELYDRFMVRKGTEIEKPEMESIIKLYSGHCDIKWIDDYDCTVFCSPEIVESAMSSLELRDEVQTVSHKYMAVKEYESYLMSGDDYPCEFGLDGTLCVTFKKGITKLVKDSIIKTFNLDLITFDSINNIHLLKVPKTNDVLSMNNSVAKNSYVDGTFPTRIHTAPVDSTSRLHDLVTTVCKPVNYETATQPVQVLETKYYNITGQTTDSPSGLILVVTRYSDGTVSTEKKLF